MKRYSILALALVLGCALLTGCRRGEKPMATMPSATQAPTQMTTTPTTAPTTLPTEPIVTAPATQEPTEDPTAAGTQTDATGSSSEATEGARGRGAARQPNMR